MSPKTYAAAAAVGFLHGENPQVCKTYVTAYLISCASKSSEKESTSTWL